MTDPETSLSLREQAERQAGELAVRVSSPDTRSVEGEVSVSHEGGGWIVKAWAKVKAMAGAKPQASAGFEMQKRWFLPETRATWRYFRPGWCCLCGRWSWWGILRSESAHEECWLDSK